MSTLGLNNDPALSEKILKAPSYLLLVKNTNKGGGTTWVADSFKMRYGSFRKAAVCVVIVRRPAR